MAYKESKKRGKSAVSGLVGGTSVVAGQARKGSAGGPIKRKKKAKQIGEQRGKGKIKETTRAQRDRARADYNTRVAADPSNPARLRPSERTPNRTDVPDYDPKAQYKGIKRKLKPGEFPGEAVGGPRGSIYRHATKAERAQETKKKTDAVRKRMAQKKTEKSY